MNFNKLYNIINKRKNTLPKNSYVATLLQNGKDAILQKIGEEATEVIIAGKNESKERQVSEIADLLFHIFVFLIFSDISIKNLEEELEKRNNKKIILQRSLQNGESVFQDGEQQ